ncbi:MAG: ABC transporter permease, partial [candidate division Zixibacteria bacterium]|nr:ABC transporter permease [candidate division Zixibacteria bacterium]
MLKNYLTIIIRNIFRQKSFSFINVAGLAVGMACCLLIMLWVQDELSYDQYHKKADNICRLTFEFVRPDNSSHFARVPYGWVNQLPELYPEVIDMVRFHHEMKMTIRRGNLKYNENRFFNVDPNVFYLFDYKLKHGEPNEVLSEPNSIILTDNMVHKY